MNNSQFYAGCYSYTNNNDNINKPKTATIDAKYKELYYQTKSDAIKETPETLQHRHVFWNYMMNVSMQNTIVQMAKIA